MEKTYHYTRTYTTKNGDIRTCSCSQRYTPLNTKPTGRPVRTFTQEEITSIMSNYANHFSLKDIATGAGITPYHAKKIITANS